MICTEAEAKTKWCPMARAQGGMGAAVHARYRAEIYLSVE